MGADGQQLQGGTEAQSAGLVGEPMLHGLRRTTQDRQDESRAAVNGWRLLIGSRTEVRETYSVVIHLMPLFS